MIRASRRVSMSALTAKPSLYGSCLLVRSLSHFRIVEHTVPCQHTRQYIGGAEPGHHNSLQLSVKQYIPKTQSRQNGDSGVTVIGAHGNGLPKELLEPFWDDLYEQMTIKNQPIRSIWVADQAYQGQSGVLNERVLGDDPSWFDHARDLLFFINLMQEAMPQPLYGVGHSMGATQLAHLAFLHPTLLRGLVLMDPVLQTPNPGKVYGLASTYRRDIWPSRAHAKVAFANSKLYQSWDSRVFDKWIEFGLRDLPTEMYPDADAVEGASPVTLATPKHNEVHFYLRPLYRGRANTSPTEDFENYSDLNPDDFEPDYPFYRPEPAMLFRNLKQLKPPVEYVFGKRSPLSATEVNEEWLRNTGSGIDGSGGQAHGRVSRSEIDCGHFIPMENPGQAAIAAAGFLDRETRVWNERMDLFNSQWRRRPRPQRVLLDDEWLARIGPRPAR